MKAIAILGSTGSIGRQTLQVVESLPEQFRVVALAAGGNLKELAAQIARHGPQLVSVSDAAKATELRERLRQSGNGAGELPEIQHGREGLLSVATHSDAAVVVSAAVGVVGLEATYAAVQAGKRVALSNKEVLVAAGALVMAAAKAKGVELLPVDSEHNAIHQCLRAGRQCEVRRLVLTASGGPFRKTPIARMAEATPEQALARPALEEGGAQTCALNAADEIAVEAFLERRLPFGGIAQVIERVLDRMPKVALSSIDDVLAADGEARRLARQEIEKQPEVAAR